MMWMWKPASPVAFYVATIKSFGTLRDDDPDQDNYLG